MSLTSYVLNLLSFCGQSLVLSLFLLGQIDSNTDGLVDFPEFVAATLHVRQLEEHNMEKWQQVSQAAFEKFDVDRDGYITPEELRMVSSLCIPLHLTNDFSFYIFFIYKKFYAVNLFLRVIGEIIS